MKVKQKLGQIFVQVNLGERYYMLFHRTVYGKYEQYIKRHNEEYILSKEELVEIKNFIKNMGVKNGNRSTKKSKT